MARREEALVKAQPVSLHPLTRPLGGENAKEDGSIYISLVG
jgi:hypothetical protein